MLCLNCVKIFLVLWLVAIAGSPPLHAESADRVRAELDIMKQWLGGSERGQGWHDYLQTELLEQELQKGNEADPAMVESILNLYAGDNTGLTRARFVAVRRALAEWQPTLLFPEPDDLPGILRDAKSAFKPMNPIRLDETRQALEAALANLDRFLLALGERKAQGWYEYILWDELQAELAREDEPDFKVLERIQARLENKYTGLYVPAFVAVRRALRKYGEALLVFREQYQTQFEKTLVTLADALEEYVAKPTHPNAYDVAVRVGTLQRAGQVPELVNAIRHHYARPNMYVQFSSALVGIGFEEEVEVTEAIAQNAAEGNVSGQSMTVGKTSSMLVSNAAAGEIRIQFTGSSEASTRMISGPATIIGSGVTKIDAHKQLVVDDPGVRSMATVARCVANNTINDVLGNPAVVNRALPLARASLPQAEARTARQTELRISRRLDEQVSEDVAEVNQRYARQYKDPLMRRDDSPTVFEFRSSDDYLFAQTAQAGDYQLAADGRPPELGMDHDLALRMHESFLNNYVETVYGGTVLTDIEAAELVNELSGRVPERLQVTEDSEPWSINFFRRNPLTVVFADDGYVVTVRGRRFTMGERRIGAMHVTARYQFEVTPDGPRRIRVGPVKVEPANFATRQKKTLSTGETVEKAVLERRFGDLFPPGIEPEGLELPGRWQKAGKLVMQELSTQNGWLVTGWRMPEPSPAEIEQEPPATEPDDATPDTMPERTTRRRTTDRNSR